MAKTKIENIVVPEIFNPYVIQRTAELSKLVQSGIVVNNPALDVLASAGGKLINMPYFNDLTGDDELLSDSSALTPQAITAGQDVAALLMRGKAWSVNDLAKALSGDDPMKAIGDLVAGYWARMEQKTLINTLTGAMAAANMTGNVHDITGDSGADKIAASTILDAKQKMGDNADKLTAIVMHSATFTYLQKGNLISFIPNSQGVVEFPTYMGYKVIVDDGCPVSTTTYTTYLFGEGAVGRGDGAAPYPTEFDRDSLAGDDILINRRHFILHPRGIAFQNTSVNGASPSNAELATDTNWSRVYDNKNIRIVQFKHKIA